MKDKERSPAGGAAKKDWDADLLTAVHKALKDPKNVRKNQQLHATRVWAC